MGGMWLREILAQWGGSLWGWINFVLLAAFIITVIWCLFRQDRRLSALERANQRGVPKSRSEPIIRRVPILESEPSLDDVSA